MRSIEVITTILLATGVNSGCTQSAPNSIQQLKNFTEQLEEKIPAQGTDPNQETIQSQILGQSAPYINDQSGPYPKLEGNAVPLIKEMEAENLKYDSNYYNPNRPSAKLQYPYIDGATPECELLSEAQMQYKREHPEETLTCGLL